MQRSGLHTMNLLCVLQSSGTELIEDRLGDILLKLIEESEYVRIKKNAAIVTIQRSRIHEHWLIWQTITKLHMDISDGNRN